MVKGLGIDIAETSRFSHLSENTVRHILSGEELDEYSALPEQKKAEFLSSRFAAKEAFVKALGCGFGPVMAHDITVRKDESGRPFIVLDEKHACLAEDSQILLSLSHEKDYSAAVVVIDGKK